MKFRIPFLSKKKNEEAWRRIEPSKDMVALPPGVTAGEGSSKRIVTQKDFDQSGGSLPGGVAGENINYGGSDAPKQSGKPSSRLRGFLKTAFEGAVVGAAAAATAKYAFNSAVRALDASGIGTALGAGAWCAGREVVKDYRAEWAKLEAEQKILSKFAQASRHTFTGKNSWKYTKKFGAGALGGFLGALTFNAVTDFDDVAERAKEIGGWLRDHVPGFAKPEVSPIAPADIEPQAGDAPQEAPQAAPEPEPEPVPEEETPAEAEMVELTPLQQLDALAGREDLSERARAILEAARAGQAWALDSAGVGILNGLYGFPEVEEMKEAAAQWIKMSAEKGFEQGERNFAYLQHWGLHGITADPEAALEKAREIGPWKGGESLTPDFSAAAEGAHENGFAFKAGDVIEAKLPDGSTCRVVMDDTVIADPDPRKHIFETIERYCPQPGLTVAR